MLLDKIKNELSETQIVDHTFQSLRSSGISDGHIFCVTGNGYVSPSIPDALTGECDESNHWSVDVNILAQLWPEEVGFFIYDSDNDNKIVWYQEVGTDGK